MKMKCKERLVELILEEDLHPKYAVYQAAREYPKMPSLELCFELSIIGLELHTIGFGFQPKAQLCFEACTVLFADIYSHSLHDKEVPDLEELLALWCSDPYFRQGQAKQTR